MQYRSYYKSCRLCPRACNADRTSGAVGYCGQTDKPVIARAALHMWEEPCISGSEGSGTIFFSGCNLSCVFCQNYSISHKNAADIETGGISVNELCDIFFELYEKGANNINLVTADPFIPTVAEAIEQAKNRKFTLPFILNTSSYVSVDALKLLDGLIDIYLADFKYFSERTALLYSRAKDYPSTADKAIREMIRQIKTRSVRPVFDDRGILFSGVIVRHLLMPGGLLEAKLIIKTLYEEYGDDIIFSLMNQYTPIHENLKDFPKLDRPVTEREYDELIEYALSLGIKNAYMQEGGTVSESFIPEFDRR